MILLKVLFLFIYAVYNSESHKSLFVHKITKCSVKDTECQKYNYKNLLVEHGETGIPEYEIPPYDPAKLKDFTVTMLGLLNVTIVDADVKGLKDCTINEHNLDFENWQCELDLTCDVIVEGKYKVSASSAAIEKMFGNSLIHGEGNGKVEVEKINVAFIFPFHLEKHEDHEIYIKFIPSYKIEIQGGIQFKADHLYIGKDEATDCVLKFLNENWKQVIEDAGMKFIEKMVEYFTKYIIKVFDSVPAKYFYVEDLTSYVKEQ